MEEILKYRSPIYGFLALWIVFFHIESTVGLPWDVPVFSSLIKCGNICVDVFLFFSGYCCCLSFKRNPQVVSFYKKRFIRVVLPYLILAIPFYSWKTITHYQGLSLGKHILFFILDISGASLWTSEVLTTWFVTAIIVFYLVSPFIVFLSESTKSCIKTCIILILIYIIGMIAIHSFFPGAYRKGCIAFTRFPVFCIGSLCASFSLLPNPNKKVCLYSGVFILVFLGILPAYTILNTLHARREFYWLIYIVFTVPLTYFLYAVIRLTPPSLLRFLSFCGTISLEIYIVHIMIRNVLVWYSITPRLGYWLYLVLPLISIPISFFVYILAHRARQSLSIN